MKGVKECNYMTSQKNGKCRNSIQEPETKAHSNMNKEVIDMIFFSGHTWWC